jgi:hypothetical protein
LEIGHFYFLKQDYFIDFPDPYLMANKETVNGQLHDRPCFLSITNISSQIYWMIPISSKISKYSCEYQKKVDRFGNCVTIGFGDVLGHQKAFLIQNMCPVTPKYIDSEYFDHIANIPVRVDGVFERSLIQKVNKVLVLTRQGKKLTFPDVLKIERDLLKQLV